MTAPNVFPTNYHQLAVDIYPPFVLLIFFGSFTLFASQENFSISYISFPFMPCLARTLLRFNVAFLFKPIVIVEGPFSIFPLLSHEPESFSYFRLIFFAFIQRFSSLGSLANVDRKLFWIFRASRIYYAITIFFDDFL